MRKTVFLALGAVLAVLIVVSGVAWAATRIGTDGPDKLVGTPKADQIFGFAGNDQIAGRDGDDYIKGGAGNDFINGHGGDDFIIPGPGSDITTKGGAGNDVMVSDDGRHDYVECASGGKDRAYIDVRPVRDDFGNCEYVNDKRMNWNNFEYETWPEAPPKRERDY